MSNTFNTATYYDEKQNIWHGQREPLTFNAQDSVGSIALQRLLEHPDLIAQMCYQSGRSNTYWQMAELSVKFAYSCKIIHRMRQDDVIGMCVYNSYYVAPVLLGSLMASCCISTLDPSFDVEGIKHIYSQTRPKIMFCEGENYGLLKKALDECNLTSTIIYTVRNHVEGVPSVLDFFKVSPHFNSYRVPPLKNGVHQTAVILCSSGTTGRPKCVKVSHAGLLMNLLRKDIPPHIYLSFSSLNWLSGVLVALSFFNQGTRIISEKPFAPEDFFDIVKLYKANIVVGPPSHLAQALASSDQLAQSDLSSIRWYVCGGSAVPFPLLEKLKRYTPSIIYATAYTTTEIAALVAIDLCDSDGSVGFLTANTEVKIIDGSGNKLGPTVRGEICVRTPLLWAGYVGNPAATKAAYDDEQWYHTGDMGYFSNEGKLYIVDRLKEILKYNNYHFAPTEIEKVINEIPGVCEACVVGIPDEMYGFLPAAAVLRLPDSDITIAHICQYVQKRMQHFEQLRGGVYFMDSLPRTASGIVVRQEVGKLCEKLHRVHV